MDDNIRNKTFKEVLVPKEHCDTCHEMLEGDGSMGKPWSCSCGYWLWDPDNNVYRIQDERPRYR